jgi:hypothetical protein
LSGEKQQKQSTIPQKWATPFISTVLKHVVSSVVESYFEATFVMAKEDTVTCTTLTEMGHPLEASELATYNSTADGIVDDTVKQKRSKATYMHLYLIKDRVKQGQFKVGWATGDTHMGGYFTKNYSPENHKCMIPYYLDSDAAPMI